MAVELCGFASPFLARARGEGVSEIAVQAVLSESGLAYLGWVRCL